MLNPKGPQPREVYLRRRAALIGAAVIALVAVVWIATSIGAGSPSPEPAPAVAAGAVASRTPTPPSTTGTPQAATQPGDSAAASSSAAAPTGSAASNAAVPNIAIEAGAADGPRGLACSDDAITVAAQVAAPSYPVGDQPVFRLVVRNTGDTGCTLDMGTQRQQILVYSADGNQRVWSSNDCSPGTTPDVRSLKPGAEAVFSVQWSGTTSAQGCKAQRVAATAGKYVVMSVLGGHQSQPVPFTLG